MELEKHTRDELKNMFNVSRVDIDETTIKHIVEILNKDSLFDNILSLEKANKNYSFGVIAQSTTIAHNLDFFKENIASLYSRQPLFDLTLEDYYRYFLLYSFGHECEHIIQDTHSQKGLYPYADLNNAYRIAFDRNNKCSIIDIMIYHKFHDNFFYERNADINGATLTMDIFDENNMFKYACMVHFNHLFANSYTQKGSKVISPIEKTIKYLHLRNLSFSDDLPFDVALDHGFPITNDEYHYLFDPILKLAKAGEPVDYDETLDRVHKLTLQSKGVSTED